MTNESSMPSLQVITDLFGASIAGAHAEKLLTNLDELPDRGVVVLAPAWTWAPSLINIGRKGKTASGEAVPMPVRLDWAGGNVIVAADGENPIRRVRIVGMGHDTGVEVPVIDAETSVWDAVENSTRTSVLHPADNDPRTGVQEAQTSSTSTGVLQVEDRETAGVLNMEDTREKSAAARGSIRPPVLVQFASKRHLTRVLRGVVAEGHDSHWSLVNALEPFTRLKLSQANGIVAAELGEYREHATATVVDDIALDDLLTQVLYGELREDGIERTSVVIRMLQRCCNNPLTFRKVDPMHFIAVFIRARAEEAIRRRIGDPKIGAKVRRVQARVQAETVDELIAEYRKVYPKDALADKRAILALTAGAEITATQKIFRDETTAVETE